MSSIDEAFVPPLKNMYGVNNVEESKGKAFYAKVFADYLQQLFTRSGGPYQEKEIKKLKLLKPDYYDYKQKVWAKEYRISTNFLKLFIIELKKRGLQYIEYHPIPIVEGPAHYFKISDNYDDKIIILVPHKRPILEYESNTFD